MTTKKALLQVVAPFVPDGCSGIPDSSPQQTDCCNRHDFYYCYRGKYSYTHYKQTGRFKEQEEGRVRRIDADMMLRDCLRNEVGEDKLWTAFVYYGVRAFGWIAWYDIVATSSLVWGNISRILFFLVGLLAGLLLFGCTTYSVTTPTGWHAEVQTMRKLEGAKVTATKEGDLSVELNGVDTADFYNRMPNFVPWPVYPQHQTWRNSPIKKGAH